MQLNTKGCVNIRGEKVPSLPGQICFDWALWAVLYALSPRRTILEALVSLVGLDVLVVDISSPYMHCLVGPLWSPNFNSFISQTFLSQINDRMALTKRTPRGKFVYKKVNKVRWRPSTTASGHIYGSHFLSGSWDDTVCGTSYYKNQAYFETKF